MRERVYSSHFVTLCHFFILEKAPFSGLKLTSKKLFWRNYCLGDSNFTESSVIITKFDLLVWSTKATVFAVIIAPQIIN